MPSTTPPCCSPGGLRGDTVSILSGSSQASPSPAQDRRGKELDLQFEAFGLKNGRTFYKAESNKEITEKLKICVEKIDTILQE